MSSYSRANATFKNYAISLGVVVAIILVMAFVVSTRSGERIPEVQFRPDIEVLRSSAEYPVTAPDEDLPEGWTPTSSTLDLNGPVEWTVGFATPKDSHARLVQSDDDPDTVVRDSVKDAEPVGTVMVGDQEWEHLESDDWGALVLRGQDRTLVVAGSAGVDEFAELAEHLETFPVPDPEDTEDTEEGDGAEASEAADADS
ncbi:MULTISPECIES: DUF4245 domain-containing protein [unclassified Nocardiopsis]|jgi:hypothetical protein|uniref:DUF4245 domain-containing protein n=1 Tax=unclassified Nocardiopsis TaxID=2649073 RepID=UPI00066EF161|nr:MULTISPECIES: DUF4245 domain-containing protein [unclassified Nocardiopsis]MBQ1083528.1 DUF4245 domain-containing protein [Nocardiopsis sp. B62]